MSKAFILKVLFGLGIFSMLASGCSKKLTEAQSEVPQAVSDLIKEMEANNPDCECHPYINQYIWRNQNVYVSTFNNALNSEYGYSCDGIPVFYYSDGEKFTLEAGYFYDNFINDSKLVRNIWACE